jgi:HEPN domain-containing protein
VPREARTRRVTAAQARTYLGKAEEFLEAARESLEAGHSLAATSLAVHAGISACDAICGARTGQRAAGSDHGQAVALLNQAGREGKDAARALTRLMPLKNRAEYEPEEVPKATAKRAVDQAERIVVIARAVVQ